MVPNESVFDGAELGRCKGKSLRAERNDIQFRRSTANQVAAPDTGKTVLATQIRPKRTLQAFWQESSPRHTDLGRSHPSESHADETKSLRCALPYVNRALQSRRETRRLYSDSDEGHQTWIDALDMVKQHLQGVERDVIKTPRGSSAAAAIRQSTHPPPTVAEDSIQDDDSSPASVLGTTSVSESILAREPESKSEPQPRSELEAKAGGELDAEAELSNEPAPNVELAPVPVEETTRLPVAGDDIFDLTKASEEERRRLRECEGKWQQKLNGEKRVESAKTLVALGCAGLIGWVLAKLYSVST